MGTGDGRRETEVLTTEPEVLTTELGDYYKAMIARSIGIPFNLNYNIHSQANRIVNLHFQLHSIQTVCRPL